jgi:formylglycine-generating enzyme required for sulfatase activity
MVRVAIALLLLKALPATAWAQPEKRVALVIGNSAYQHTPKLINPKNDATDMVAALKKHGFQVLEGFDLDKATFDRKVRDFATVLSTAQVGVFFYAGHGLQVSGHNYLVPIDAQLSTASALDFEMVRLDLVHRTMEREAQTNILFLDACRDNPLARNLARAMGTRSTDIGRGLAHVESGVGTLISFSTQPGNVALDGTGRNSPFAGALVKQLASTNDDLFSILVAVRNDVMRETQRKQVPWEHSALTGRFYFSGTPVAPAQVSEAERAWRWVKNTTDQSALENFITEFGDTPQAELAQARLDELRKKWDMGPSVTMPRPTEEDRRKRHKLLEQKSPVAIATPPPSVKPAPGRPTEPPVSNAPAPSPTRCDGVEALVGNERRCRKPKDSFRDCPECPEMVVVAAGEFMMGSPRTEADRDKNEGPQRKVTIAKPFAVGKFEVTFAEWDACVAAGGCKQRPGDQSWGRGRRPVINVSWNDAREYGAWLSKKTGSTYRLLTEAEWEYAARAGTTTPFSTGHTISTDQANFDGNYASGSKDQFRRRTLDVGSFQPNAFGLYDMHGNVAEWVQDCYEDTYSRTPLDGRATAEAPGCLRVLRGGSGFNVPRMLRAASRDSGHDSGHSRHPSIGFRLARTLSP